MTRTLRISLLVALLASVGVAGVAATGSHAVARKKKPALALRSTSLGKVLVDSKGRTLYMFGADTKNKSNCADACADNWPPAQAPSKLTVGPGVSKRKLKVIKRADGSKQLSYAGHPLYRFIADSGPGDVNGQNINAFGGIWNVVAKSGKAVTTSPQSAGTQQPADPAPSPAYPGY
jgi:predicted lipoprotein with Yx(FWY)xxD motif